MKKYNVEPQSAQSSPRIPRVFLCGLGGLGGQPVEIKVWRDHELILRLTRRSDTVKSWYVRVPTGRRMMMLQIEASRTWRPADYGRGPDQRERGVMVGKWRFSFDAPKGEFEIKWPASTVAR